MILYSCMQCLLILKSKSYSYRSAFVNVNTILNTFKIYYMYVTCLYKACYVHYYEYLPKNQSFTIFNTIYNFI